VARPTAPRVLAATGARESDGASTMAPFPIVALGLLLLASSVQSSCGGRETSDECSTYGDGGYGYYGYYDAYCP
jgi:hypothetical protein